MMIDDWRFPKFLTNFLIFFHYAALSNRFLFAFYLGIQAFKHTVLAYAVLDHLSGFNTSLSFQMGNIVTMIVLQIHYAHREPY